MDILGKLFSSNALVKIMRLFLSHPDTPFTNQDICDRSSIRAHSLKTEIAILSSIGFVKKKSFYTESKTHTKNKTPKKKRVYGWCLNQQFKYLYPLKMLLLSSDVIDRKALLRKIGKTGNIKTVLLAGIFIDDGDSEVDIFIVGNHLDRNKLQKTLRDIESEIGREINYAAMDSEEFEYRLSMYDKFVRDILDYPHDTLVDKIGL